MQTKKGWNEQIAISAFTKESVYNTGETFNATNFCSLKGFEATVEWDDVLTTDKDETTNTEFGTDQEITEQGVKISIKEPKAKPNTIAALGAYTLGAITSTQDGVEVAYKHKETPVAVGTALSSMSIIQSKGGLQYSYTGVKSNSLKIAGEAGGYVSVESELIGSGTRTVLSAAYPAIISESWMKLSNCKVWMESGANISISATLVQDAEDISSATPDDLKARIKSFEWGFNNNLEKQLGFGGAGVAQDIDYGRRTQELKFTLLFNDSTELAYFTAQNPMAIEFDLKGAQITGSSTMYFGMQLIIPRFKIKTAPLPQGGVGDAALIAEFDCDIQDDGTNDSCILEVYNAQAAYMA